LLTKGTGQQYELPKRFRDEEEVVEKRRIQSKRWLVSLTKPDDTTTKIGDTPNTGDDLTETTEEDPVEAVDRSASSGAGGLDLASWATGFRKARSARQKSGRPAQGLASQKKNPFKSWA
jgi:hypothetical protein